MWATSYSHKGIADPPAVWVGREGLRRHVWKLLCRHRRTALQHRRGYLMRIFLCLSVCLLLMPVTVHAAQWYPGIIHLHTQF